MYEGRVETRKWKIVACPDGSPDVERMLLGESLTFLFTQRSCAGVMCVSKIELGKPSLWQAPFVSDNGRIDNYPLSPSFLVLSRHYPLKLYYPQGGSGPGHVIWIFNYHKNFYH